MNKLAKQLFSMVSDKDWDTDAPKAVGLVLVAMGVIGFFLKLDYGIMLGTGAGMLTATRIVEGK